MSLDMTDVINNTIKRQNERKQKPLFRENFDEDVYGESNITNLDEHKEEK